MRRIIADIFVPRVFEVEIQSGPSGRAWRRRDDGRLEQRHAATDIRANEVRINERPRLRTRANGRAFARMQIPESRTACRTPSSFAVA